MIRRNLITMQLIPKKNRRKKILKNQINRTQQTTIRFWKKNKNKSRKIKLSNIRTTSALNRNQI